MVSHNRATFPPEIIDQILKSDELYTRDLANCCLVSKVFLDPARKSLYHSIKVGVILCLFPQDAEALGSDDSGDLTQSFYLDVASSRLLWTLLGDRHLGALVNAITYCDKYAARAPSDENIVWMQPPDLVTTFARLCPLARTLSFDDLFELSGNCKETMRVHCKSCKSLTMGTALGGDCEELRHYKQLTSLTVDSTNLPGPPFHLSPLGLSITYLCVGYSCRPNDLKAFPSSTWRFLRDLRLPVNVVSEIRASQFPQLHRLALTSYRCIEDELTPAVTRAFLKRLGSFGSLRIFDIEAGAHASLDPKRNLLCDSLPSGCRRVTFRDTPSFDAILDVVQQSETKHRITELGLEEWIRDATSEADVLYLAAARAAVDVAHVEIIWISKCEFELPSLMIVLSILTCPFFA